MPDQQKSAVHDDMTLADSAWAPQKPQTPQTPQQPMRQTPPPGSFPAPVQPTQGAWSPANQQQNAPWAQQPAQGAWSPANQQPTAYPQGMQPGTMNSAGAGRGAVKRQRKWPLRVALVLVVLLAVVLGGWFLGVRPYLNNLAKTQLNQAFSQAQSEINILRLSLPSGPSIVPITEGNINDYLRVHATAPLENLHASITPAGLSLNFTIYGFNCTVFAVPIASNGSLQVMNVQTQGLLGFVISSDELTSLLNNSLLNIGHQIHRSIDGVRLRNQVMELRIH